MSERQRASRFAAGAVLALAIGFTVWTYLTFRTHLLHGLDASSSTQHLTRDSNAAQMWAALSFAASPFVVAVAEFGLAYWAWKRRLRNLAWALTLAPVLAWLSSSLLHVVINRRRPASTMGYLLTSHGSSYPSSHVTVITAVMMMVIATTTTLRLSRWTILGWRVLGFGLVVLVGVDRWILNAHYLTDIVGGVLLGGACASLACLICGVHMQPTALLPWTHRTPTADPLVCAIIHNPAKVVDLQAFRRHVEYELRSRGYRDGLWLSTTISDPGYGMAREALQQGVDLVLVAGGDGTVRVVTGVLAHSGVPVGLIPSGTGNLLARNLGISLDETEALQTAFDGTPTPVDLIKVSIDGSTKTERFGVMAGVGIDARIIAATNADLKRAVGSAAYFVAAAQEARTPPTQVTIKVDDGTEFTRRATLVLVGNVSMIQAGIRIFPDASAMDGLLDVVIASPERAVDWAEIAARALVRTTSSEKVDFLKGRRVHIKLAEPTAFELDGDTAGNVRELDAEVDHGALLLMR